MKKWYFWNLQKPVTFWSFILVCTVFRDMNGWYLEGFGLDPVMMATSNTAGSCNSRQLGTNTNCHPKMITGFLDNWNWHQVSSSFVSAKIMQTASLKKKSTNQPLRLQTYWRRDGAATHLTCCRFEVQALCPTCEQFLGRGKSCDFVSGSLLHDVFMKP